MFIGYLRIPQFPVVVARRDDPALAEGPLILVEEHVGRASVYAACQQASACGVQTGMSLAQAGRLCPEARLIPAAESAYLAAFEACLEVLGLFTSKVEPEGLGCAYLDLTDVVRGPDEAVELYRQLARQLGRDLGQTPFGPLMASMGITTTMFGAAVAGIHVRPGFALALPAGVERGFLSPFPTRVLPVSGEMIRRLQLLGLRTIGQYAALPSGVIVNQFGWEGQRAHRLARGQDDRRVHPGRPRLIETAVHSFEDPIADTTVLAAARDRLVSQLVNRIRERYLAPQALHLQLSFETGPPREARVIFPAPRVDEGELQRAAGRLSGDIAIRSRVTEVRVGLGKLQPLMGRQLMLFPTQADQERQMRRTLANLARRYGGDGFRRPQVVDADSLVLERRFVLNRWQDEQDLAGAGTHPGR
ncbi:MAG: hypothetical protein ACE5MB_11870, partial [Anaerolineae bacterium]